MIARRIVSIGLLPLCFIWLSVIEKNVFPLILLLHIAVHEGGHLLAALLLGVRPTSAEGRYIGMNISFSDGTVSYKKELLILLSGSGANFVFLLLSLPFISLTFVFYYLSAVGIAMFNLLPLGICDGGKALSCILLMLFPEDKAVKLSGAIHFISAVLFLTFAVCVQFVYRINLSLMVVSIYILLELILSY